MEDVVGYTDCFLICSGQNARPRAGHRPGDRVRPQARRGPRCRLAATAAREGDWILLDYLDVVVHLFTPEARDFYRLEQLWGQVPQRQVV